MAAITGGISVSMKDVNNAPTAVLQPFSTSTGLIADTVAYVNAYLPLLDAVTGDQILDSKIIVDNGLPSGLKSSAVAGINNSNGALVDFLTTVVGEKFSNTYPGAMPLVFVPTNQAIVDLSTGSLMQLLTAFLTATSNNTRAVNEDGFDLASVLSAIKNDRSQRPALRRRHRR